jgi:hypothetical protein
VIASHFAKPLERKLGETAPFRAAASPDAELIEELAAGDSFHLLEDSRGWAWGYGGPDRRVGYIRSDALS